MKSLELPINVMSHSDRPNQHVHCMLVMRQRKMTVGLCVSASSVVQEELGNAFLIPDGHDEDKA
jgi:hypothetical protein